MREGGDGEGVREGGRREGKREGGEEVREEMVRREREEL